MYFIINTRHNGHTFNRSNHHPSDYDDHEHPDELPQSNVQSNSRADKNNQNLLQITVRLTVTLEVSSISITCSCLIELNNSLSKF